MLNRKGQSTLEYAIIIAVVMAGLWLMQNYVKRGYQGKLKESSDQMGEQYDPSAYTGNYQLHSETLVRQTNQNKIQNTEYTADQITDKTGQEALNAFDTTANVYNQP